MSPCLITVFLPVCVFLHLVCVKTHTHTHTHAHANDRDKDGIQKRSVRLLRKQGTSAWWTQTSTHAPFLRVMAHAGAGVAVRAQWTRRKETGLRRCGARWVCLSTSTQAASTTQQESGGTRAEDGESDGDADLYTNSQKRPFPHHHACLCRIMASCNAYTGFRTKVQHGD
jgi:hypothetical protein